MQKQANKIRDLGPILGHCPSLYKERWVFWLVGYFIIPPEKLLEDNKRQKRDWEENSETEGQQ